VDYLSAPQANGAHYRDPGPSGITRALIESIRLNGKLFLDEMDQTPSWKWLNNVDTAFQLTDLPGDIGLMRRNSLEGFTRGAGVWWYDFGPSNQAGWWADTRLMAEITKLQAVIEKYQRRDYAPAGDVLLIFDTEVFYYTGSIQGTDPVTDVRAVNRTIFEAWKCGAVVENVHLRDIEQIDLARFKVVMFANTWLMAAAQRKFIRERVVDGRRHVVFQGFAGYCDGTSLRKELTKELVRGKNVSHFENPPVTTAQWREICRAAGAHVCIEADDIIHAGAGLLLVHTKDGGEKTIRLRSGKTVRSMMPPKHSIMLDAATGAEVV